MISLLLASSALASSLPWTSYAKLVSGNGHGAVVFSEDRLSDAYPHLYQAYDPDTWTPEILYDTYFGITGASSGGAWLTDVSDVSYEPGTGVVTAAASFGSLEVTTWTFAPMGLGAFGVAQVARVRNTGTTASDSFQVVSLHNWHVGGTERVTSASAQDWTESGSDVSLVAWAPDATDVSCAAVWDAVNAGQRIGGGCNTEGGDIVPAFGWGVDGLAAGEERWFGVVVGDSTADLAGWSDGASADRWVEAELDWWASWQAGSRVPDGLSAEEAEVYAQSLAFLKMAQVTEPGPAYGQIPASMPASAPVGDFQHVWNITWVRDASYAIAALAGSGHADEAAAALSFMIQPSTTGEYRAYVGDADYAVSVCRIYGNGLEWSDADADGPNVEFDNFGLFLWALGRVHAAGGVLDDGVEQRALDGVADVLVRLVDPNTGLLLPDSSIWERHWNGNQQQFTYSSAWGVAGLRAAADLAERRADPRSGTYREAADRIEAAIPAHLLDAAGVVAASREQLATGGDYLDLAAVEVFNLGILDATGSSFDASLEAWDRGLRVASGNGYRRNDDGSTYDEHEWAVIDLRLAEALRRSCRPDEAAALEDWITGQAVVNDLTVPELYAPDDAAYAGPAPMLGFGAGAYALALLSRAEADAACEASAAAPDDQMDDPAGCGCAVPAGGRRGASFALPALIALALFRRRP